MGRAIGGEALKILNSTVCRGDLMLKFVSRRVKLKLKPIPETTDKDVAMLEARLRETSGGEAENIKFKLLLAKFFNLVRSLFPFGIADVEIQGFRIGGFVAVLLPGEIFVDLGLMIKSYSKADLTMVIGCANEVLGYVPTDEAFDEGGYEVNFPVCIVERDSGRLLVETAYKIIDDLLEM
jgi:hypothetical protein